MQILADTLIKELMQDGKIRITPEPKEKQMQPVSVDLTLGKLYRREFSGLHPYPQKIGRYKEVETSNGEYLVEPGVTYRFTVAETLRMKEGLMGAYLAPRSSLARGLVSVMPMGQEQFFAHAPFKGKVFGYITSHGFPLRIRQGERIVQSVFITKDQEEPRTLVFNSGNFMKPKEAKGYIDLREGIKDSDLFEDLGSDFFTLRYGNFMKVVTEQGVDYSDGRKAGIVRYRGGEVLSEFGGGMDINNLKPGMVSTVTGWAPFVDAGYKGKLTAILQGTPAAKFIVKGSPILTMDEFSVKGEVERLYGSNKLGSHYQKNG